MTLSLQRLGSLLWDRFEPGTGNFHILRAWPTKQTLKSEKTKKKKHTIENYQSQTLVFVKNNTRLARLTELQQR